MRFGRYSERKAAISSAAVARADFGFCTVISLPSTTAVVTKLPPLTMRAPSEASRSSRRNGTAFFRPSATSSSVVNVETQRPATNGRPSGAVAPRWPVTYRRYRLAGGKDIADPAGERRRVRKIPHRAVSTREKDGCVIGKAQLLHRWCRVNHGL